MTSEYEKVYDTCKELFTARGYKIKELDSENWIIQGVDTTRANVGLFILPDNKLNIEIIKYYYSLLSSMNMKRAILVYQQSVTSSVKKIITNMNIQIELFHFDELKYNILKHTLVPKHTKVDSMKTNEYKYPLMRRTDAVARFMGYKHGDIIRIDRKDKSIYFRYVK
jgi:DNA-directed RNA polymerase subunit H (RpoH/RPB5)